jgi:hypothetical protein
MSMLAPGFACIDDVEGEHGAAAVDGSTGAVLRVP